MLISMIMIIYANASRAIPTDPVDFTLSGAREVIRYSHHHFAF
jgi:hypothetical protein